MTNYYSCCEDCFDTIAQRNTTAAKLWMDLCAMRLCTSEVFALKTEDFPELRILEVLGYVVSSETDQYIKIKMQGYYKNSDDVDLFCVKEGYHD